jgi:methyl-accepting chemotaxis protein
MKWTIGRKLLSLSGVALGSLVMVTSIATWGLQSMSTAFEEVTATNAALRNHMECDMMHDAIRGDVLAIVHAESDEKAAESYEEFKEHAGHFRKHLAENEALPLRDNVKRALATARPSVEEYLDKADAIGEIGLADRKKAGVLVPAYEVSYEDLEGVMANASDLIESSAREAEQRSTEQGAAGLRWLAIISLLGLVAAVVAWRTITKTITGSLAEAVTQLEKVSKCDLTGQMRVESSDEVAVIAKSLNAATTRIGGVIASVARKAESLAASSQQLDGVSRTMREIAGDTASQANQVSAAAGEASQNMRSASAGVEAMGRSIEDIAGSVTRAANVVKQAVDITTRSTKTIGELDQRSVEIEEVLKLITSIADQTNLLALNAAIEAARAGEAGKGFVVVANEVKELARETAKATEDIGRRIDAIRSGTARAVEAVGDIRDIITEISELQSAIQKVVDEQSHTAQNVRGSVEYAANASSEISDSISLVAQVAERSMVGANETQQAASELASIAEEVRRLAAVFRYKAQAPALPS